MTRMFYDGSSSGIEARFSLFCNLLAACLADGTDRVLTERRGRLARGSGLAEDSDAFRFRVGGAFEVGMLAVTVLEKSSMCMAYRS